MANTNKPAPSALQQVAGILKNLKPVETYIQHRQQLLEAFEALEAKKTQTETENKAAMRQAGSLEAKRLMGEALPEEEQAQGVDFSSLRDRQDRLQATEDVLCAQQRELDEQFEQYDAVLRVCLGAAGDAVLDELEAELVQIGKRVSHVLNRLCVLGHAVDLKDWTYADRVRKIEIPSIRESKDHVIQPFRLHPRDNTLMGEAWRDDPAAVDLDRELALLGAAKRRLRFIERDLEQERKKRLLDEKTFAA